MIPWFENIHCCDNLREILEEGSEEKHLIEPLEASHVERSILRKIERSNVKGVYMIDDIIEGTTTRKRDYYTTCISKK
jgi:hypothetical protein